MSCLPVPTTQQPHRQCQSEAQVPHFTLLGICTALPHRPCAPHPPEQHFCAGPVHHTGSAQHLCTVGSSSVLQEAANLFPFLSQCHHAYSLVIYKHHLHNLQSQLVFNKTISSLPVSIRWVPQILSTACSLHSTGVTTDLPHPHLTPHCSHS